jgi:hypothetical protein
VGIPPVGPPPGWNWGEITAMGSRIDCVMYSLADIPGTRVAAQDGASLRSGNSEKLAPESGPLWHVAQPLAWKSDAPSSGAEPGAAAIGAPVLRSLVQASTDAPSAAAAPSA